MRLNSIDYFEGIYISYENGKDFNVNSFQLFEDNIYLPIFRKRILRPQRIHYNLTYS